MLLTKDTKVKLDNFGWDQQQHDRFFHTDIYVLNTHNTLKHFTLHQTKYLSRILNELDDAVNLLALADMFIILTATATATRMKTSTLFERAVLPPGHIDDSYALMKMLINGVSLSAKVCEGLDHVEKQDYHRNLEISMSEIMEAVYQLATWKGLTQGGAETAEMLITMCNARLLQVEMFHPQFKNLKAETFSSTSAFNFWFGEYVRRPTQEFLMSIKRGEYHWANEDYKVGAINDILVLPFKEFAIRNSYLDQGLDGTLTVTKLGEEFITQG